MPLHLAGLVMMRAEKSKRFLLIFRRVLTSSSSSLTWIVRCSWSPIRFCDRKTQRKSVRRPGLTAGDWRLVLPSTAASPKPFRPLPLPSPTQTSAPPAYTISKFWGSFLPIPNLHRAPRTGSTEERTPPRGLHQKDAIESGSHLFPCRVHLRVHLLSLLQVALLRVLQGQTGDIDTRPGSSPSTPGQGSSWQ